MKASIFFTSALGAVAVTLSGATQAQKATVPDQIDRGGDIIVTAAKQTSTVQKTPFAVGVVTGQDIANKAENSYEDVLR
ncbi:MAG: hypothetical protein KGQ42_01065, partial [Alphaproteobacteria bacterium]|nr:hypothetical protein [Alphaproteobacteria bacterium]